MSSTSKRFTFAEQQQVIVKFLQKHYNCIVNDDKLESNKLSNMIDDVAKAKTFDELFDKLDDFRLFGFDKYFLFMSNFDSKHPCTRIWMPIRLDKKISNEEFDEYLRTHTFDSECLHHSAWYNITPRRWKNFTKFFDYYYDASNDVEKINNSIDVKKDVAFLTTENNSSDYVANCGDTRINLFKRTKSDCDESNSIYVVIDAYYAMIDEFKAVIDGLQIAKLHGAKYVVDSYFANTDNFIFDK